MNARPFKAGPALVTGFRRTIVVVLLMTVAPMSVLFGDPASVQGASPGSVSAFGDAVNFGSPAGSQLNAPLAGIAPTPDGQGYWLLGADGGVFAYGDAQFYGSDGASGALVPFVGIARTPSGHGYWIADSFGTVNNFGDAPSVGPAGVFPAAPVVGMAATGIGYWLVAADGGVFSFGDAVFYGSMGGKALNAPIVGMAASPDGHGYWLVAADGGVFSFGDAAFHGSAGANPPSVNTPMVAMAATTGAGYWLATTAKTLPPPTPVPSVLDQCNVPTAGPAVRPSAIVLACGDGNASLINLAWSLWTQSNATAVGDYTHNTCTPDCAQGTFVTTPATVRLSYPVRTSAGQVFATISYTYANSSAPGGISMVTTVIPTGPG